jgi:hypothetical protein
VTICNLRIEGGNDDGVVNTQLGGSFWRVVNNELTATTGINNLGEKAGGVVGSGMGEFWVGNHVHDIYQGPKDTDFTSPLQNHGMYVGDDPVFDGNASYEVAYNHIENIFGGNGFQVHVGSGITGVANNINLHHNLIHDVGKHGINIADGAKGNIVIWNNIVYNTSISGIRFGGTSYVRDLKLYNNTFYNTVTLGMTDSQVRSGYGAITNEMNPAPNQLDLRNNIFQPAPGTKYVDALGTLSTNIGIFSNNLWFGGSDTNPATTFSTNSVQLNPLMMNPATANFRLQTGSPAIDSGNSAVSSVVTDDFDSATTVLTKTLRPQGTTYDIGAFEK